MGLMGEGASRGRILGVLGLLLWLGLVGPAQAQLLMVTGEYRVVEVDARNHRIGVALLEASPDLRQNWVYIGLESEIVKRHHNADGWFKDEAVAPDEVWGIVKKGDRMTVHGGRQWDGGIKAKKISM